MSVNRIRIGRADTLGTLLALLLSAIGVAAFGYPFFLSALPRSESAARAHDAPLIFGLLMPLLLLLLVADLSSRRMNAKVVSALGILVAINVVLRIPTGLGDSPTFFFLPILLGYAYGAGFGFLHGTLSLFVSALVTVGIGPWLPFQMLAMGWLGMGGAALRLLRLGPGSWREITVLAIYGYVAALLFGMLMNLYFWPFLTGVGGASWEAGLSLTQTAQRYWAFYALSGSLAWDAVRAVSTAGLLLVIGRPLLRELRRFHDRFFWTADAPHSLVTHDS